jgi:hypothetical protein
LDDSPPHTIGQNRAHADFKANTADFKAGTAEAVGGEGVGAEAASSSVGDNSRQLSWQAALTESTVQSRVSADFKANGLVEDESSIYSSYAQQVARFERAASVDKLVEKQTSAAAKGLAGPIPFVESLASISLSRHVYSDDDCWTRIWLRLDAHWHGPPECGDGRRMQDKHAPWRRRAADQAFPATGTRSRCHSWLSLMFAACCGMFALRFDTVDRDGPALYEFRILVNESSQDHPSSSSSPENPKGNPKGDAKGDAVGWGQSNGRLQGFLLYAVCMVPCSAIAFAHYADVPESYREVITMIPLWYDLFTVLVGGVGVAGCVAYTTLAPFSPLLGGHPDPVIRKLAALIVFTDVVGTRCTQKWMSPSARSTELVDSWLRSETQIWMSSSVVSTESVDSWLRSYVYWASIGACVWLGIVWISMHLATTEYVSTRLWPRHPRVGARDPWQAEWRTPTALAQQIILWTAADVLLFYLGHGLRLAMALVWIQRVYPLTPKRLSAYHQDLYTFFGNHVPHGPSNRKHMFTTLDEAYALLENTDMGFQKWTPGVPLHHTWPARPPPLAFADSRARARAVIQAAKLGSEVSLAASAPLAISRAMEAVATIDGILLSRVPQAELDLFLSDTERIALARVPDRAVLIDGQIEDVTAALQRRAPCSMRNARRDIGCFPTPPDMSETCSAGSATQGDSASATTHRPGTGQNPRARFRGASSGCHPGAAAAAGPSTTGATHSDTVEDDLPAYFDKSSTGEKAEGAASEGSDLDALNDDIVLGPAGSDAIVGIDSGSVSYVSQWRYRAWHRALVAESEVCYWNRWLPVEAWDRFSAPVDKHYLHRAASEAARRMHADNLLIAKEELAAAHAKLGAMPLTRDCPHRFEHADSLLSEALEGVYEWTFRTKLRLYTRAHTMSTCVPSLSFASAPLVMATASQSDSGGHCLTTSFGAVALPAWCSALLYRAAASERLFSDTALPSHAPAPPPRTFPRVGDLPTTGSMPGDLPTTGSMPGDLPTTGNMPGSNLPRAGDAFRVHHDAFVRPTGIWSHHNKVADEETASTIELWQRSIASSKEESFRAHAAARVLGRSNRNAEPAPFLRVAVGYGGWWRQAFRVLPNQDSAFMMSLELIAIYMIFPAQTLFISLPMMALPFVQLVHDLVVVVVVSGDESTASIDSGRLAYTFIYGMLLLTCAWYALTRCVDGWRLLPIRVRQWLTVRGISVTGRSQLRSAVRHPCSFRVLPYDLYNEWTSDPTDPLDRAQGSVPATFFSTCHVRFAAEQWARYTRIILTSSAPIFAKPAHPAGGLTVSTEMPVRMHVALPIELANLIVEYGAIWEGQLDGPNVMSAIHELNHLLGIETARKRDAAAAAAAAAKTDNQQPPHAQLERDPLLRAIAT